MGFHTTAGVSDPHGAAQHTDVTRELFLTANEGHIKTGVSADIGFYGSAEGGANLNEPRVYFSMKVPDDFVSFTKVEAVWLCGAAAGNMYWQLQAHYAAPGEAYATHSDSPAMGETTTGGASKINVQEPSAPLTLVDLAPGDYLGIYFYRIGTNVLDTLDAVTDLLGLLFTYTASQ